ncbi:hypothetical protein E0485_08680 [Paenibacillus albiflavus]|uniref:Uncharacterized protein n=1 Tax=Paenibacillus albiflavus TaxID=2545760 RepID=A0A4R4EIM3_9BACL|nr:hypothetical protein [Paenibacillus albiflavus]TCZ78191.1 hypothetical protein E0485_08680 [Paenibacillus albiflavus]
MIQSRFGQGAAIRFDGKRYNVCFASNGVPAVLQEFDLVSGDLLFREPVPNTGCCWGMCSAENGDVYLSGTNDGVLYRYSSDGLKAIDANPSDSWVWQLFSINGKVFGGTYPGAKVFEYDIETGSFQDYGIMKEGQNYVRGITADEHAIYAGIGATKHVIRIDRTTGELVELQLEGISGSQGFVDRLWVIEGYLFVSCTFTEMHVFRLDSLVHVGTFPFDNMLVKPNEYDPGRVYFKWGRKLCYWDIVQESWNETEIQTLPEGRAKALEWLYMNGEPDRFNGQVSGTSEPALALVTVNAQVAIIRLSDNQVKVRSLEIEPQPIEIHCLETGDDGKLYMGGYQRGFSLFDPDTDTVERTFELFPQPEGMTFLDGIAYFGTYREAQMFRFDPHRSIDFGFTSDNNPGLIGEIGHLQDRPFAMTSGGGRVFAGTVPDYGVRGGALAMYDPAVGKWETYPNIVPEHSVLGVAYKDGLIYGGTSLWGGLGTSPAEGPARMFIWDVAKRTKVAEFVPDIPDMDMPPCMIGELSAGPDGLIWGAIDGTLFAMDPVTTEIIKSKIIVPSEYKYSKYLPIKLRWGSDGYLYTTLARRLIVVDPATLEHVQLSDRIIGNMALDRHGRLYYVQGKELYRMVIPDNLFK